MNKVITFFKSAYVHGLMVAVLAAITDVYFKFKGTTPMPSMSFMIEYGSIVCFIVAIYYAIQHAVIPSTSLLSRYNLLDAIKTTGNAIAVYLGGMAANGLTGQRQDFVTLLSGCIIIIIAHVWITIKTDTGAIGAFIPQQPYSAPADGTIKGVKS